MPLDILYTAAILYMIRRTALIALLSLPIASEAMLIFRTIKILTVIRVPMAIPLDQVTFETLCTHFFVKIV